MVCMKLAAPMAAVYSLPMSYLFAKNSLLYIIVMK